MQIEVALADYHNPSHRDLIPRLLDAYASDPMGGGTPLKSEVKETLVTELAKLPHAFSLIAWVDGEPAGLMNCFELFSTFACKPLINIHDVVVLEKFRRQGVGQRLLEKVEAIAKEKGCCKLTLEVLDNNEPAKKAYTQFGFSGYELDPEAGSALFWEKEISYTNSS